MKRENPLLIYRHWFAELNWNLADDIAQALFETDIRCQRGPKPLISSHYYGLASIALLTLLERQIRLPQKNFNQQFAMTLLDVTRVSLMTDGYQTPSLLEECKEQYIRNLALGNQAEANYFEQLVTQLSQALEQQNAWINLEVSGFNLDAIQTYIND